MKTATKEIKTKIDYSQLLAIDIQMGEVVKVGVIENKDNLYKLTVDFGEYTTTCVAPLKKSVSVQYLLNKTFPFVMNLPKRKFDRGLISHCMILCSHSRSKGISLIKGGYKGDRVL